MTSLRTLIALAALTCAALLTGCASSGSGSHRGGGYYKDDGPGSDIPSDILSTPDATPRIENHARANRRPYRVFGKTYVPLDGDTPFRQEGVASWYGKKFHGNKTANGETYDMYAMTAAHPTLPLPSYARVTRLSTGKSVVVRINDRGPFHSSRIIDLSYAAAAKLGLIRHGSGRVVVEAITNTEIARAQAGQGKTDAPAPTLAAAEPVAATPAADAATGGPAAGAPMATDAAAAAVATPVSALRKANAAASAQSPHASDTADALSALTRAADAAPPPAAPVASRSIGQGPSSGVYLQFGAFSGQRNAELLARRLNPDIQRIEGRQVQVEAIDQFYRVQLGPYASRDEATDAALRIQQETGSHATLAVR